MKSLRLVTDAATPQGEQPQAPKPIDKVTTKSFFDLDSFTDLTLVKNWQFTPVKDTTEALARLGNDSSKFLSIINEGLMAEQNRQVRDSNGDWKQKDDEGNLTDPPSTFTPVDRDDYNALVRQLAISVFGYTVGRDLDDATKAKNNAAREAAKSMIKSTEVIRDGLKKQMAARQASE